MIWEFICRRCLKYKTHGRQDKNGYWVCIDCLNNKEVKNGKRKNR